MFITGTRGGWEPDVAVSAKGAEGGLHRKDGGEHSMSQCCLLCSGHHKQLHNGRLMITGLAPDLTFEWRPDDDVETATSSPAWDYEDDPTDQRPDVRSG